MNKYTATDPSLPFLQRFEQNFSQSGHTASPWELSVKPGLGSSIPMLSSSVSCVLAAQCFHWMADDATLDEIARVSEPDTPFIMIWNYYDCSIDWLRRLEFDIVDPIYKAQEKKDGKRVPRFATHDWKLAFETNVAKQKFQLPVQIFRDSQTVVCSEAAIIERVLSTSVVHLLEDDKKKDVSMEISKLLRTHPETKDSTSYNLVYEVTVAHVCTK